MPADPNLICACHHLYRDALLQQFQRQNVQTLEQARQLTRAASSCGFCWEAVEQLIAEAQTEGTPQTSAPTGPHHA